MINIFMVMVCMQITSALTFLITDLSLMLRLLKHLSFTFVLSIFTTVNILLEFHFEILVKQIYILINITSRSPTRVLAIFETRAQPCVLLSIVPRRTSLAVLFMAR